MCEAVAGTLSDVSLYSIQQCLVNEGSSFRIDHVENAVYKAIQSGTADDLQRLLDNRPDLLGQKQNLNLALRYGGLQVAKWFYERFL